MIKLIDLLELEKPKKIYADREPGKEITIGDLTPEEYEDLLAKTDYNEDKVKNLEKDITLLEARLVKITDKTKNLEKLVDHSAEEKSDEDIEKVRQQLAGFSKNVIKTPLVQDKNTVEEKLARFEKQYQTLSYLPINKLEIDSNFDDILFLSLFNIKLILN